jgi:serine protease Do
MSLCLGLCSCHSDQLPEPSTAATDPPLLVIRRDPSAPAQAAPSGDKKRPAPRPSARRTPTYVASTAAWPAWKPLGVAPAALTGPTLSAQMLFERLAPSVLSVEARGGRGVALGSAVAISATELLTNCHVLSGAQQIVVKQGNKHWQVAVGRADPGGDRCLLLVPDPVLTPVSGVRRYGDLKVGEPLYTLGSPSGLELTIADGILSGLREESGRRLIQTTAPISPGSSGGGLFDARGNLVGITTGVLAGKERLNQSLNFAIPADAFWQP